MGILALPHCHHQNSLVLFLTVTLHKGSLVCSGYKENNLYKSKEAGLVRRKRRIMMMMRRRRGGRRFGHSWFLLKME